MWSWWTQRIDRLRSGYCCCCCCRRCHRLLVPRCKDDEAKNKLFLVRWKMKRREPRRDWRKLPLKSQFMKRASNGKRKKYHSFKSKWVTDSRKSQFTERRLLLIFFFVKNLEIGVSTKLIVTARIRGNVLRKKKLEEKKILRKKKFRPKTFFQTNFFWTNIFFRPKFFSTYF